MFKKNRSLGVQSTFKDDLSQYTTVHAEGSTEDRERAAKIAKEIESNDKSKRMAFLENDDEERDLDKETVIPDEAFDSSQSYHQQKRNSRGSKRDKPFPQRKEIIVPENHRANALRDPPPPPRNRQLEHGRQRDRGNHGKTYQAGPSNSGNNNNDGQNRQQPPPLSQQQVEQENSANQKSQNFSRRKEDLKSWQNNFNAAYRQNSQSSSTSSQKTPVQTSPSVQEQEPQFPVQSQQQPGANHAFQQQPPQPTAPIYPPRPTNAWQKGPPDFSSLQPTIRPQQKQHPQPPQQAFVNPQFNQPPPNVTTTVNAQPTEGLVQEPQYTVPQDQNFETQENHVSDVPPSETATEQSSQPESENSNTKFQFNPDAPSFVPRMQPLQNTAIAQPIPIVTVATQQPYSQGYATHIPQSLTNPLPPGYILTTQGVGMQPTFIPQQISYVPTGVPIYNQQIVTSTQGGASVAGGGYSSFVHQPQTFVVRSNYDMTNGGNGGGYIQTNLQQQPQHLPQLQYAALPLQQYHIPSQQQQQYQQQPQQFQYAAMPLQQYHNPQSQQYQRQPQQQFQPQLPYSQPPPKRYGQN
jgi:hypothetical protein